MERDKAVAGALRDIVFLAPFLNEEEIDIIKQRLEWVWQIGYEEANTRRPINKKPIAMYNRHGLLLATFESVSEAASTLDLQRSTISIAARKGHLTKKGHYWKYIDEKGNQLKE